MVDLTNNESINANVLGLCEVDGYCPWKFFTLDENSFVADLGAFRGDFSRYILDTYNCRVHAYEPSDMIYPIEHPKFTWIQKIVWDGTPVFFDSNRGPGADIFENIGEKADTIDIKDITNEHIDLLKVNVEGAEMVILNRANLDNIDQILVEFHLFKRERKDIGITKEKIDDLVKLILEHGFKFVRINNAPSYFFYK